MPYRQTGSRICAFGTDQPFWEPKQAFETLSGAQLPEEAVRYIETTNAVSLFRL